MYQTSGIRTGYHNELELMVASQDIFVGLKVDPPPQQDAVPGVRRHGVPGALPRVLLNDLAFVRS